MVQTHTYKDVLGFFYANNESHRDYYRNVTDLGVRTADANPGSALSKYPDHLCLPEANGSTFQGVLQAELEGTSSIASGGPVAWWFLPAARQHKKVGKKKSTASQGAHPRLLLITPTLI